MSAAAKRTLRDRQAVAKDASNSYDERILTLFRLLKEAVTNDRPIDRHPRSGRSGIHDD